MALCCLRVYGCLWHLEHQVHPGANAHPGIENPAQFSQFVPLKPGIGIHMNQPDIVPSNDHTLQTTMRPYHVYAVYMYIYRMRYVSMYHKWSILHNLCNIVYTV
jgi:hypothetical protein